MSSSAPRNGATWPPSGDSAASSVATSGSQRRGLGRRELLAGCALSLGATMVSGCDDDGPPDTDGPGGPGRPGGPTTPVPPETQDCAPLSRPRLGTPFSEDLLLSRSTFARKRCNATTRRSTCRAPDAPSNREVFASGTCLRVDVAPARLPEAHEGTQVQPRRSSLRTSRDHTARRCVRVGGSRRWVQRRQR